MLSALPGALPAVPSAPEASSRFSSTALSFPCGVVFLQCGFHVFDHFVGGIERAIGAPLPEILFGLSQPGINHAALFWGVFVIGVRKLRPVNNNLRGDDDLSPLIRKFDDIAL